MISLAHIPGKSNLVPQLHYAITKELLVQVHFRLEGVSESLDQTPLLGVYKSYPEALE